MEFIRVGDKVLSLEKLENKIKKILKMRAQGSTQAEVAEILGVDRSFISHLEGLGEVRKGFKVGLIAFPVKNKQEVERLAEELGVDVYLVMSQEEREKKVESQDGAYVFNEVMEILTNLVDCDAIIVVASDLRIKQAEKIFGEQKVFGVNLGKSPIRTDISVDIAELRKLIENLVLKGEEKGEARRKRKFRFFKKKSFS
ncbi:MAG: transcriptional regulator [Actinobacteria bacterium]|nr:transcriptional regulator [Actinomycetota bacterium]